MHVFILRPFLKFLLSLINVIQTLLLADGLFFSEVSYKAVSMKNS